jgi:hypothetical protein
MNTFKKTSLNSAVLAGLGAVVAAGSASAVHVNPDGTGQVLLYPYYTVRSDGGAPAAAPEFYDNYLTIVNSTSSTKAVKVRILEGKNSREVLDFNLYMSPQDVWVGAIVRTTTGGGLISGDNSCVVPTTLFAIKNPADLVGGANPSLNHFKNFEYSGTKEDGGPTDYDRGREGYVEVLEMGDVTNPTVTGFVKHGANGVPANCPAVGTVAADGGMAVNISRPTGGLFGRGALVNVVSGSDFSYDAVAIDDWSNVNQYTPAGSTFPRLSGGGAGGASNTTSNVFTGGGVVTDNWGVGATAAADAISATIMHASVMNEFNVLKGTQSGTDWVVTFPTKKLYVNAGPGAARAPFTSNYNNANCGGSSGAPDPFSFAIYNREEQTPGIAPGIVLPSPLPPQGAPSQNLFCYEANALTFNPGSSILGSTNGLNINPLTVLVDATGRPVAGPETNETGWLSIDFVAPVQQLTAPSGRVYRGLPVIGVMVEDYLNNQARPAADTRGRVSTYGGSHNHKYRRNIR